MTVRWARAAWKRRRQVPLTVLAGALVALTVLVGGHGRMLEV